MYAYIMVDDQTGEAIPLSHMDAVYLQFWHWLLANYQPHPAWSILNGALVASGQELSPEFQAWFNKQAPLIED